MLLAISAFEAVNSEYAFHAVKYPLLHQVEQIFINYIGTPGGFAEHHFKLSILIQEIILTLILR